MTITSLSFGLFVLLVVGIYYLLPSKTAQNILLLIASYAFLISWNVWFAVVFFCLTLINYLLGLHVQKRPDQKRIALYGGIEINILALVFFKYSKFFVPDLINMLSKIGVTTSTESLQILLPIGLSFFTVQAVAYLVDIAKGISTPAASFIEFAVYTVYFPRLVSGPIERAQNFLPKLKNKRTIQKNQLLESAALVIQGLVRKIVIADLLFWIMPYDLFRKPGQFSAPVLVFWLVAYSIALYNDFAGYTSIARGVSCLLGIPLVENFKAPFLAQNFTEFWQRWHISLSNWLREYIFMPATRYFRKRKSALFSTFSVVLPPLITMFVSALWHNISLNMLLWGGLYGIYLIVERLWSMKYPAQPKETQTPWKTLLNTSKVFVLVTLAWAPFRADLPTALDYWAGMFLPVHWIEAFMNFDSIRDQILNRFSLDLAILAGLSFALDIAQERFGELAVLRLPAPARALLLNLALLALIFAKMALTAPPPFVYQGF